MPALIVSQGPSLIELSGEIGLLQIDLQEEKFRNSVLEFEVKRHKDGIMIIKSYRHLVSADNDSIITVNDSTLDEHLDDNVIAVNESVAGQENVQHSEITSNNQCLEPNTYV